MHSLPLMYNSFSWKYNWIYPFVNDRNNSKFPRMAKIENNELETINKLLKENLPDVYSKLNID